MSVVAQRLLLLVGLAAFGNATAQTADETSEWTDGTDGTDDALTYVRDVKPLLDANCVECHSSRGRDPDLTAYPFKSSRGLDQEEIVKKMLVVATPGGVPQMPPGRRTKLTTVQLRTIRTWLEQGLAE